jgi:hypothetical protein
MKNQDQNHLLYIEPTIEQKSTGSQDDCITEFMQELWKDANAKGLGGIHRGFHTACDGTHWNGVIAINGDNKDIDTIETHAACIHYLRWFRQAIPSIEWQKLLGLAQQFEPRIAESEALITAIQVELEIAQERESQQLTAATDNAKQPVTQSGEDFMSDLIGDIPTV